VLIKLLVAGGGSLEIDDGTERVMQSNGCWFDRRKPFLMILYHMG